MYCYNCDMNKGKYTPLDKDNDSHYCDECKKELGIE